MFQSAVDPHKLDVFLEINNHLNSRSFDLTGLFHEILNSAMELTRGESASLLLLDNSTGKLVFTVALGPKGEEVKSFTLEMGEGIAGWVAQNNVPLHVPDVAKDSRFAAKISRDIGYVTQNILAVPLRVLGHCVGVLEIINKKDDGDFSAEDLTWLELFANQAGLAVQNAQSIQSMKDELVKLKSVLGQQKRAQPFVTADPRMNDLLSLVRRYATTDSTVLILGENGTGKELIAEMIHSGSSRAQSHLVKVNCAALPEALLESELFGHTKGAFTDAVSDRRGRFEMAQGGTLFLDEIATLTPVLQAKLLRVLQSRTVERVGGGVPVPVDVRVIAATNQDLEMALLDGSFRRDLFYRLNVLPVKIPPLRERRLDISLLARFFLEEMNGKMGTSVAGFQPEALDALESYDWPGNVRELKNVLERSVLSSRGGWIEVQDLGLPVDQTAGSQGKDWKTAMASFKGNLLNRTLREFDGNQTKAAKALGIQRTYLSKLLRELQMETNDKGEQHVG